MASVPSGSIGLRRSLGLRALVLFGLVSIAPISSFSLFGYVNEVSGGAVVSSYVLGAAALILTALSFATMAGEAPQAGSVYGYAGLALGPFAGFIGGWAILLDYLLVAAVTTVYGAVFLAAALPGLPEQPLLLVFAAACLGANVLGVGWSSRVDMVVCGLQLLFAFVFAAAALALLLAPGGPGPSLAPVWTPTTTTGGVVAGASVAVVAFLGFDAISTLAEEVRDADPSRRVAQATVLCVLLMLGIYVAVGWLLADLSAGIQVGDPVDMGFAIVAHHIPWLALPLGLLAGLALGLGVNIATHAGASRIVFAMARDGRLPRGLAAIHPRLGSPWAAAVVTFAAFAALMALARAHTQVLLSLVSVGALSGFLLVNLAVIVHCGLRRRSRCWLRDWVLPAAGVVTVGDVLAGADPLALEAGAAWFLLGAVLYLIRRRPADLPGKAA